MLELKNITYTISDHGKKRNILNNVSLKIEDGELVVITGPNGSGKSTLAKIIMGIISATSGQILYNGTDITEMNITERAKLGFSFAFQQPVCFKGLIVKDLIDIATQKNNSVGDACKYLSRVGLCAREYVLRQIDNKLSGGELKRIELATVLAKNSTINIFDEPEAGIDLWSFDALVDIFKSQKTTNIIISHQQKIIEIAKKVVLIKDGEVFKIGSHKDVLPLMKQQRCAKLVEE